jgi:hypothetical protein
MAEQCGAAAIIDNVGLCIGKDATQTTWSGAWPARPGLRPLADPGPARAFPGRDQAAGTAW